MKTVFQEEEFGCGIACIAMLGGLTYSMAKKLVGTSYRPGYGMDQDPLLSILNKLGLHVVREGKLTANFNVEALAKDAILWGYLLPKRGEIRAKPRRTEVT